MFRRLPYVALLLAGCGAPEAPELFQTETASSPVVPEIRFQRDWRVIPSAPLVAGGKVKIVYDNARLPDCRGELNDGRPAWSIGASASLNGAAPTTGLLFGYSPDPQFAPNGDFTLDLPASGDLAIWFQITNRWGCQAWDSNYGANFHFPVAPAPRAAIHFSDDWQVSVDGALQAGAAITLDYDIDRLPSCRQGYNGMATWDVLAFYRFDGGDVASVPVTRVVGMDRVSAEVPIAAPDGARTLELWFKNTDRAGCVGWDSRWGQNYVFGLR